EAACCPLQSIHKRLAQVFLALKLSCATLRVHARHIHSTRDVELQYSSNCIKTRRSNGRSCSIPVLCTITIKSILHERCEVPPPLYPYPMSTHNILDTALPESTLDRPTIFAQLYSHGPARGQTFTKHARFCFYKPGVL
ncbi:unnamed protein product, partial [Ectocarpus sp. 6 AP-2014]